MDKVTEDAIRAIGADQADDWQMRPETHAASLPPEAGPLARILTRPGLRSIISAYLEADSTAKIAQRRYKRLAAISANTSFLAVVLVSLLILVPAVSIPEGMQKAAAFVQFGFLATSLITSLWIGAFKPFTGWMRARALAETKRLELFETVVSEAESPKANELPVLPLQLEYVRRYQLGVQRSFYQKRGAEHHEAATRRSHLRWIALCIIGVALVPMLLRVIESLWSPPRLIESFSQWALTSDTLDRLFLSLGQMGGALQGVLAAYALLGQDERNSARYDETLANLKDLSDRPLTEARAAAAAGNEGLTRKFVALLHLQISSEHREWIALRKIDPTMSLDRLSTLSLPKF